MPPHRYTTLKTASSVDPYLNLNISLAIIQISPIGVIHILAYLILHWLVHACSSTILDQTYLHRIQISSADVTENQGFMIGENVKNQNKSCDKNTVKRS